MGTSGKQVYSAPELKEIYTDPQLTKHGSVAQLTGSILPIQPTSHNSIAPQSAPLIPGSQRPSDGQQRPADDVVLQQGILQEGVPYLSKPVTIDALGRKVRETIDE